MRLVIEQLILWPRDTTKARREIRFEPGKVNVLTGQSRAGKSAIVWIIDYCLGSSKCAIPVGVIRDTTAWYGLKLKLQDSEIVICRRDPDEKQSTTEAFMAEGASVSVPEYPQKNTSIDTFVERINQLSGMPSLDFRAGLSGGAFKERASFRDLAAFNFQPQHIVANPYALFFKADTYEHRERLKTIFPLLLGAITPDMLALQHELSALEQQRQELESQLDSERRVAEEWIPRLHGLYLKAKELGLTDENEDPEASWPVEKYKTLLSDAASKAANTRMISLRSQNTTSAVMRSNELADEERTVSSRLSDLKFKLAAITNLQQSATSYESQLKAQTSRLGLTGWLSERIEAKHSCPLCGNNTDSGRRQMDEMLQLANKVESLSGAVKATPGALDKEVRRTKVAIEEAERRISRIRATQSILFERDREVAAQRQTLSEISRFGGQLDQLAETLTSLQEGTTQKERLKNLRTQIAELTQKLSPTSVKSRMHLALEEVSKLMQKYKQVLDVERPDDSSQLVVSELTLKVAGKGGRTDYLWEIGSGANWMAYHVSILLSLHEFFLKQPWNPVPSFLLIDQPSQVYFPESWPEDQKGKPTPASKDIEDVRKVFMALSQGLSNTKSQLQIIVTDHAGAITWKGVENVHLVDEWRGDRDYLIPRSWLSDTKSSDVETATMT